MATKIRLQRFGKKGKPIYHIVAADSRSKRDGRSIERIGSYDPNISPAKIDINHDRALYWVQVGAVPTDTVRTILSYTGVMMKKHLLDGVKKGAHTEEQAIEKHHAWLEAKAKKIGEATSAIQKTKADAATKALEAEKLIRANREAEIKAKNTPVVEEAPVVEESSVAKQSPLVEDAPVAEEAPVVEKAPVVEDAPVAEQAPIVEEAPVVEKTPVAEKAPVVEDAPVAEQAPVVEKAPVIEEAPKGNDKK
jgi:small subunit ribosomal protein S16